MSYLRKLFSLLTLAFASALLLSACGGGDAGPPAESVPPTLNITSASGGAGGAVTFTFTFSEDVGSSFTADKVSVTNGTKGAFTKLSAVQYTLVVTPAANAAGTMGVSIAAGAYADLVGNGGGAAASSAAFDTRPPVVTIASSAAGSTASGAITFTFTFSKDVGTTFTASDVTVTGATAGTFTRISGTSATLVVTPPAATTGTASVAVAAGAVADGSGSTNTAAANLSQAYSTIVKTQMSLPVSFDVATVDYTMVGFGGAEDSSVVVDPTNAANMVAKVVRAAGSETYAGTTLAGAAGLGFASKVPLNASQTKMSVRVWSPDAGIPVRLKLEDHADPTKSVETEVLTTAAAAWQTLTFDFSVATVPPTAALNLAYNYDKATIFFDFGRAKASAVQKTYYFDDVAFVTTGGGGGGGATAPTTAAATPPVRAASDVLSIYSDAYTPIAGIDLNPNWGQSTVPSDVTIAGNKTRKYANLNYQGIDWAGTPIDVTGMSKLHIDLWSDDVTSVKVSIISAGQENPVTLTPTAATWSSFDIDLAQYTVPNKAAIIQIKIEGTPTGGTLYFDNLYFWKAAAVPVSCGTTAPTCAPTAPTVAAAGVLSIYSEQYTTPTAVAGVFNPYPNWGQATQYSEATIAGNKSLKYVSLNYEGIDWTTAAINVSTKGTLHLDLWSPDLASVKVSLISTANGKENFVSVPLVAGQWNSVDIPLSQYNVPDLTKIDQMKFDVQPGSGTLYVDNIYFYGTGGATPSGCTDAGCAGPVSIPVATASDKFGFILAGDAIYAADYIGPIDTLGNHALFAGATTTGTPSGGTIGYFNDTAMSTSSQKLEEGGWVSGSIDQQGVPNFFRYFVLQAPASAFSSSYMGLFVNAPSNGTVNVSSYASIKFKLWGPASMYEQTNFNPVVEITLAGPKTAGCTATGSGGTEISKTFTANQKIGAGSSYKLALTGWTVKGVCGTDTSGTAAASVLSKLAQVIVTVPSSSFNFTNANAGTPVSYSTGVNLGMVGFTNQ
jgi:hypothetical protein